MNLMKDHQREQEHRWGLWRIPTILCMLPLLVWSGFILYLSSQTYEQQTIIPWLMKRIDPATLSSKLPDIEIKYGNTRIRAKSQPYRFTEFLFRKFAHVFVYLVLSLVTMIALYPLPLKTGYKILIAFLFCLSLSVIDEFIQSVTASRSPMKQDIFMDMAGVLFGLTTWISFILLRKD